MVFLMKNTTAKESRLNIRCDVRARELLDKAATYTHVSISEFVLSNALASAKKKWYRLMNTSPYNRKIFRPSWQHLMRRHNPIQP
jgi:hypothetical protein